jgi:hypothetical protein
LFYPYELSGHLKTQVLVVFSEYVQGLSGQTYTHFFVESSPYVLTPLIPTSGHCTTHLRVTLSEYVIKLIGQLKTHLPVWLSA